jgi:hypothetical protein
MINIIPSYELISQNIDLSSLTLLKNFFLTQDYFSQHLNSSLPRLYIGTKFLPNLNQLANEIENVDTSIIFNSYHKKLYEFHVLTTQFFSFGINGSFFYEKGSINPVDIFNISLNGFIPNLTIAVERLEYISWVLNEGESGFLINELKTLQENTDFIRQKMVDFNLTPSHFDIDENARITGSVRHIVDYTYCNHISKKVISNIPYNY